MLRLFVAVELGPEIQGRLVAVQDALRACTAVRWVRPENLHLTLRFLGEVPQERTLQIREALEQVARHHSPLEIVLEGVGAFPGLRRPRVLWVGVSAGQEALGRIARHLDRALEALGFRPEGRGFVGHVTLGRVAQPGAARLLEHAIGAFTSDPLGFGQVSEICLFRSRLHPIGPMYSVLQRFALGAPVQAASQTADSGSEIRRRPGVPPRRARD